jgi:trehalose 6-phosphate synthase
MVREARPDAKLAHCVHIPWPVDWTTLPEEMRRALHEGLLANDVVGFQTERWQAAFAETCGSLGLDCGTTLVTSHPISVDAAEFDELASSGAVLEREAELVADRPEILILRVDRTDPSKNVVRGLEAFELLLERRPDLCGRAVLLALLDPSRQAIPEYVEERERIEAAAARLEERFPGALRLRIADDFPEAIAAYKQFDVLLVNAVMDGLNLVAKEAPLVNTRDGVVVLSVDAGAWEELGEWALGVDPLDVCAQADALERALGLPAEERHRRAAAISTQVRTHDLAAWIRAQLDDLDRATSMRS